MLASLPYVTVTPLSIRYPTHSNPITMLRSYDDYKARAIRMLDGLDKMDSPAFLVVTSGYLDDEEGRAGLDARVIASDPRMLQHLVALIYAAYPQVFGQDEAWEEEQEEEGDGGEE